MIAPVRRNLAGIVALLLLSAASPAAAGSIGFRTDVEVRGGAAVDAKVTLTNTGDEPATDISVHADLDGRETSGPSVGTIAPGASHSWDLHLTDAPVPGVHAIVVKVRYSDANGYPFEVVSVSPLTAGVEPAPRLFGSIDIPRLAGTREETARLTLKRPARRSGDAQVRLVVPSGVIVEPERLEMHFDDAGKATASVRLRNESLLAGTTVNVYALAAADDPGFRQVDVIRGSAHIAASAMRVSKPRFYEAAAAVALLLLALEIRARMRGGNREEAAA